MEVKALEAQKQMEVLEQIKKILEDNNLELVVTPTYNIVLSPKKKEEETQQTPKEVKPKITDIEY